MFLLRLLAAVPFVIALVQSAQAGGFADFNQGLEARNRGDADAEIAAFTRALADGGLSESMKSAALYDRGTAYLQEKNYGEAIADFTAVIAQTPDYLEAYAGRADSYVALGKYDAAMQDCDRLTSLMPECGTQWANCGRLAFLAGMFDQASSRFQRAIQIDGQDRSASYELLWLGLAGLRSGKTAAGAIGGSIQSVDGHGWPSPLIAFILGRTGEAALQAAAATGDAATRKDRQCEVGFYLGEWKLAYRDRAGAKSLFQQAVNLCPADFLEYEPAKAELAKLKGDAP